MRAEGQSAASPPAPTHRHAPQPIKGTTHGFFRSVAACVLASAWEVLSCFPPNSYAQILIPSDCLGYSSLPPRRARLVLCRAAEACFFSPGHSLLLEGCGHLPAGRSLLRGPPCNPYSHSHRVSFLSMPPPPACHTAGLSWSQTIGSHMLHCLILYPFCPHIAP